MWKAVFAGTVAMIIAGSSWAYSEQRPIVYAQNKAVSTDAAAHWQLTADDMKALLDARMVALKTALTLTPEQEKNWPAVEQALRDLAKQRFDRMSARRNNPNPVDPIERLRRRSDAMTQTASGLKRLADAAQPLYQSLDEGQKHRLMFMVRSMQMRHQMAFAGHHQHEGAEQRR